MGLGSKIVYKALETGFVPVRLTKLWMKFLLFRANRYSSLGNTDARNSVFRQINQDLMTGKTLQQRGYTRFASHDLPLDSYDFFLGKYLNFACGYFSTGSEDLDEAEENALWMAADKARIRDGMTILEIGCNNGALSLYIAKNFPNVKIIAITDTAKMLSQLKKRAEDNGFSNIEYLSCDYTELKDIKFDRIICLERFDLISFKPAWEKKIKALLNLDGMFFLQTPVHYAYSYYADSVGMEDYPGNNIISEDITPSFKTHMLTNQALHLCDCWEISGEHYKMTADKWFRKFVFNKDVILKSMQKAYGHKDAKLWYERWKLYLLGQYERFGYNKGQNWVIGQYLYK